MATTLYSNIITFALYDELGQQVNLCELVDSVVQAAHGMTLNDRIEFEIIAQGFNPDPATGKYQQWTDSWLVNQLRDRLPKVQFYVWSAKPEDAGHPQQRLFTIKRNRQVADLSYLKS
jgi:hypothetical protein